MNPKAILGWPADKPLADFEILASNLRKEGQSSRADSVLYLIERVKLAESRPDELEAFCRFAEKEGYLDSDWYSEQPELIDRYKAHVAWLKGTQT